MLLNIRSLIFVLTFSILLTACQGGDASQAYGNSKVKDKVREEYHKLGEAGIGDAYKFLADDAAVSGGTFDPNGRIFYGLALAKNSSHANREYADKILKVAIKLPIKSHTRKVLLDEAEKRVDIAIRNSLILDFATQGISKNEKYDNDIEYTQSEINSLEIVYQDIKTAQRGEEVSAMHPDLRTKK